MSSPLKLRLLPTEFAVCRLSADSSIPPWATSGPWFSITRTSDELSIVCESNPVPADVRCEKTFRAIAVEGPLDFALTGILASLTAPLAMAAISIFSVSTFDTDYVLVRESGIEEALRVLAEAGHTVIR